MIKDENYYTIQGWMRNRLHLKGNDLHVYAMLYSFSQDGQSEFRGSLDYMADFTGGGLKTVKRSLSYLEQCGLIEKEDYHSKTGRTNGFKCVPLEQIDIEKIGRVKMTYPIGQNDLSTQVKMTYPIPYNNTYNKVSILKEYKELTNEQKEKEHQSTARAKKKTHEEIMEEFNVAEPLREELRLWLTSCYNKGNFVFNEVLEDVICNLYDKYGRDTKAQCKVVRNALESGYVRIVV